MAEVAGSIDVGAQTQKLLNAVESNARLTTARVVECSRFNNAFDELTKEIVNAWPGFAVLGSLVVEGTVA